MKPRHAAEIAAMLGQRMTFLNEAPQGARFSEPQLKALRTGDPIRVHFVRGDQRTGGA